MSYNRKEVDRKKGNNLVAKHDFNKGGFHGKSKKAQRTNFKQNLNQYDIDDLLEEDFESFDNYEDY